MSTFQIALIITGLIGTWVSICYIDNKYGFSFAVWFNGECENPFKREEQAKGESKEQNISAKDEEIAALKERIQVLEKIVTEPAYELNQKINELR